jgi:hypothetical protein
MGNVDLVYAKPLHRQMPSVMPVCGEKMPPATQIKRFSQGEVLADREK